MNRFEIGEIVVVDVDADAEVETSVTTVDDFKITKLDEAGQRGERDETQNQIEASHLVCLASRTVTKA